MYRELLVGRQTFPLGLDVGQGNVRSGCGGGRAGVRLVGGGSEGACTDAVGSAKSDFGARQTECLHGERLCRGEEEGRDEGYVVAREEIRKRSQAGGGRRLFPGRQRPKSRA